jgi:hypothetical protein
LFRVEPVPSRALGHLESESGQVITVLAAKVIAPWTFLENLGANGLSAEAWLGPATSRPRDSRAIEAAFTSPEMALRRPIGSVLLRTPANSNFSSTPPISLTEDQKSSERSSLPYRIDSDYFGGRIQFGFRKKGGG